MEEESDTRKINNSFLRDQNYATEGIWTYDAKWTKRGGEKNLFIKIRITQAAMTYSLAPQSS